MVYRSRKRTRRFECEKTIMLEDTETDVLVHFLISPGFAGNYLEPKEETDVEISQVVHKENKQILNLSKEQDNNLREDILDDVLNGDYDHEPDYIKEGERGILRDV